MEMKVGLDPTVVYKKYVSCFWVNFPTNFIKWSKEAYFAQLLMKFLAKILAEKN